MIKEEETKRHFQKKISFIRSLSRLYHLYDFDEFFCRSQPSFFLKKTKFQLFEKSYYFGRFLQQMS